MTGNLEEEAPRALVERLNLPLPGDDVLLVSRALTHRSYLNEHPEALEDNERLEFLGDAVLDFLVAAWLYNRFPEMAEGDLTKLRSALVRREQLAGFARNLGLGGAMKLGRGEAESGGRDRDALLCATFEALIGALYLGTDIGTVRTFVQPMLELAVDKILLDRRDQDAKSLLQEWAQGEGYGAPIYRTISSDGPDHAKIFEVEVLVDGRVCGSGTGPSKQAAAKSAARAAMRYWGIFGV